MKIYAIITALTLSTAVAVAAETPNMKKVNKVVKSVVESEQTELITKLEVKFDERSNLKNVASLKTGATLSATAKESIWSKKPTTVDVKADLRTLTSDAAVTKAQIAASLGSKTEAVSLYAYAASVAFSDAQEEPIEDENDKEWLALFEDASKTTSLRQIPNQLERFVALLKKEINGIPEQQKDHWVDLVNSLKVTTSMSEVTLKTTVEVAIDFFDAKLLISDLSLKISEGALSVNGKVAGTMDTEQATQTLDSVKAYFTAIENADEEIVAGLKDMAHGYVTMAEEMVKGEQK